MVCFFLSFQLNLVNVIKLLSKKKQAYPHVNEEDHTYLSKTNNEVRLGYGCYWQYVVEKLLEGYFFIYGL